MQSEVHFLMMPNMRISLFPRSLSVEDATADNDSAADSMIATFITFCLTIWYAE